MSALAALVIVAAWANIATWVAQTLLQGNTQPQLTPTERRWVAATVVTVMTAPIPAVAAALLGHLTTFAAGAIAWTAATVVTPRKTHTP